MEEVVILDADGRPVKGMQLDRNTIHLGEANGGYMGCTKESVIELQQERLERFTKNRKAHQKECMSAACDITPIMLAGFDNPYDEIHNLILQGYNNVNKSNSHKIGLLLNIKKLGVCLYNIGNNMETSGLLLVSVFCNMQRTP